jgi:hypothetical protein
MKIVFSLLASASVLLSATASQLPFLETFDGLTNNVSIQDQNEWMLTSGTNAIVQSGIVAANSTQALEIQNSQITHSLSNTETSVWISFQARISAAPDTNPAVTNANTSVAFFVNTNLNIVVYSNTTPVELSIRMETNIWTRFDVYCDYSNLKWMLSVNGTNEAANLDLYSASSQIESLLLANEGPTSVYFDELAVQDTEPATVLADTDNDGIPDWWEQRYVGSITSAATNDVAVNGLSFLQNYVAGLNPDNSTDLIQVSQGTGRKLNWARKSGRKYDVYWTADLATGFTPIYTDVAAGDFEDTATDRTERPAGFYQIRVRR